MLGNTPTRQTDIFLERNKSFALNVRFTLADGSPYSLAESVVRLVAKEPAHFGGEELILLIADTLDAQAGLAQFQFQAAELDLEPAEYPFDVTLLPINDYSVPVLKGLLVIGSNTDPDNSNVYTDASPDDEVLVVLGGSCDVVVKLGHTFQPDTTWTLVGPYDPGDPSLLPNPGAPYSSPLWIDTSETISDTGEGDPEWSVPELQNNWVDYTVGSTKPAVYRKVGGGLVVLEGAVAPGRTGATILNLPVGYRPNDGRLTFTAPCEAGVCRIDLLSNGDLVHVSGEPGAWVSLSDIAFYGEAGTAIPPEEEEDEDMYGEHLIIWDGENWTYRGNQIVSRPTTIPTYETGARAVWDTSLDPSITTPPPMAVLGDVWFPHGEVDPTA